MAKKPKYTLIKQVPGKKPEIVEVNAQISGSCDCYILNLQQYFDCIMGLIGHCLEE